MIDTRRQRKRRPRLSPGVVILALILLAVVGYLAYPVLLEHVPTNQMAEPPDPNNPVLIVDGVEVSGRPYISQGTILLPIDVVREYFDPYIFWDEDTRSVVITTRDRLVKMSTESLTAFVNREPLLLNVPVMLLDDEVYVPMDVLEPLYSVRGRYYSEAATVFYDNLTKQIETAIVARKNAVLRTGASIREPIVKRLAENEPLRVVAFGDGWYIAGTQSGHYGFVNERDIEHTEPILPEVPDKVFSPPWQPDGKINLTWEHVLNRNPDTSQIPDMPGLNVISPTWFSLLDEHGTIENKADAAYVRWAHQKGLQVWALVDNGFDPKRTSPVLRSLELREAVIQQLLAYAALYDLNGINIDFENVYYEDKDYLTQFVRELAPLCREQGLVLSMDVTVKSTSRNWSMVYDRRALGEVLDYMMVMAYDEHPSASRTAGSVGSLPWVEKGITGVLEEVPAKKVLLGVPFYTRLWCEETKDGVFTVTSRALGMQQIEQILSDKSAVIQWDAATGQNFGVFRDGGAQYKVWIEDERSMASRVALVHKYSLAGIASWRRGFEKPEIWHVIKEGLERTP